jgi:integrase
MPTIAFTDRWLQGVKAPESGQVDYFDRKGIGRGRSFGLRVSYGGKKVFFVMYRHSGKLKRLTLDQYNPPAYGLKRARTDAEKELKAIIEGRDRAAEKQAEKAAETVQELVTSYISKYAKRNKKSWRRDQEILDREVIPKWGTRKARDIKRADVNLLLDGIVNRGAPIAANRALATIRKMYNWAIERDLAENNPCYKVGRPAKENQRDRVLSDTEIKTFWGNFKETDITAPVQIALKLILVTAQRKGEIIHARKDEFDLSGNWWTIPGERVKNGMTHRVPLTPLAVTLVKSAIELSGDSRYLFPSPRDKDKLILDTSVDMAIRRNRDKFKIEHFTPHDLRRTAASKIAGMGIPRLVVSKILNHAEQGITAVYDRHSYDAEKRQALNAWSAHLQKLFRGKLRASA